MSLIDILLIAILLVLCAGFYWIDLQTLVVRTLITTVCSHLLEKLDKISQENRENFETMKSELENTIHDEMRKFDWLKRHDN